MIQNNTIKKVNLQYRNKSENGKIIEVSKGNIIEQYGVDAIVNSPKENL